LHPWSKEEYAVLEYDFSGYSDRPNYYFLVKMEKAVMQ
jgi:hypothetical protein